MIWQFVLIAYSGLFAGFLQCLISPEELKSGYKWFFHVQNTTISAVIYLVVRNISGDGILSVLVAASVASIIFILGYKVDFYSRLFVFTPLFLYLSGSSELPYVTMLLFIAGMARVSMDGFDHVDGRKLKNPISFFKKVAVRYILYLPVGLLPFLLS